MCVWEGGEKVGEKQSGGCQNCEGRRQASGREADKRSDARRRRSVGPCVRAPGAAGPKRSFSRMTRLIWPAPTVQPPLWCRRH